MIFTDGPVRVPHKVRHGKRRRPRRAISRRGQQKASVDDGVARGGARDAPAAAPSPSPSTHRRRGVRDARARPRAAGTPASTPRRSARTTCAFSGSPSTCWRERRGTRRRREGRYFYYFFPPPPSAPRTGPDTASSVCPARSRSAVLRPRARRGALRDVAPARRSATRPPRGSPANTAGSRRRRPRNGGRSPDAPARGGSEANRRGPAIPAARSRTHGGAGLGGLGRDVRARGGGERLGGCSGEDATTTGVASVRANVSASDRRPGPGSRNAAVNTTISAVTMVTANVGLGAVHAPGCVVEAPTARRARLTGQTKRKHLSETNGANLTTRHSDRCPRHPPLSAYATRDMRACVSSVAATPARARGDGGARAASRDP